MQRLEEFIRKYKIVLQVCLIVIAIYFLSVDINRPLANYDEATYAKVVVDTIKSGNVLSFTLSGNDWYEKPPLYLWLVMGSVKIFGEQEFAFRIPSILASLICLWLTYLIVRKLSKSELAGATAFLILLFSSLFIYFAKEIRLDSSVLATILAAFFFWIKAWDNEKYLFWVLPLVATGFLFKSVIIFLVFPVLLIYSLFYQRWAWIKNKYLWFGLPLALIIFIPWHLIQISRFGKSFIDRYFWFDVYGRATKVVTGDNHYYDYINYMWVYCKGWLASLVGMIILFISLLSIKKINKSFAWRSITASLLTFLFIIILFSIAKTHLSPYIMPAYPFIAIFVSLLAYYIAEQYGKNLIIYILVILPLIVTGVYYCFSPINIAVLPDVPDEVSIGKIYKELNTVSAPLYTLEWPMLETMNYYGSTKTRVLSVADILGKKLKGPFFLVVTARNAGYFYSIENGLVSSPFNNLRLVYTGRFMGLLYFSSDTDFPAPPL